MPSASASITAPTSRSRRRTWCWRRSQAARGASGSAPPSRCCRSDDPIRVFQRFSTLDALSNGRAEVILGRGSFVESFPLFGFDLKQVRGAVQREARPVRRSARRSSRSPGAARSAPPLHEPERPSEDRIRPARDLDRCRRHAAIRPARRALRHAADAGDHRRRAAALRAVRRPLPPRARRDGQAGAADRRAFARLRRRNRRRRRARTCSTTTSACATRSAASAAGRR